MPAALRRLSSIARAPGIGMPLVQAGLAAAVVWIFADPEQGDLIARALLAAGLMLWSFDTLAQSRHAMTTSEHPRDPHRWSDAARLGGLLAALLLILFGVTPASVTGALAGAAIAAALSLVLPHGTASAARESWDTARPMTAEPLRRGLYHLWPALALGLLAGLVLAPPDGGWNPTYVMFQAAFLPFLLPLYPSKGRFLGSAQDRLRIAGLILLAAGVWIGAG